MYELTVSVSKHYPNYIQYIDSSVRPLIEKIEGIIATDESRNNNYITVACGEIYRLHLLKTMSDVLTDILSVGYKREFLAENLNMQGNMNFYTQTLLNAMSVFDNASDKQIVKNLLLLKNGECCLDGYYNFRMAKLKSRWTELVNLANDNAMIMYDKQLIKEFLAYLLESVPSSVNTLSVVIDADEFNLFDSKGNVIKPLQVFGENNQAEHRAIINMMCLKPKFVKLYCDEKKINSDFLELSKHLFNINVVKNS